MKRHLPTPWRFVPLGIYLFCTLSAVRSAEIPNQFRPAVYTPTPQTWSFIRYGNTAIDHYTGTARADIPLYDCTDPDFRFSIGAGYASGGFMPQRQTGILGLNWFLDCGGAVTREIRGRDDFAGRDYGPDAGGTVGFLCGSARYSDEELFALRIGRHNYTTYVCDRNSPQVGAEVETDADIFRFNFPGHSGSFHFDGQRNLCVYDTGGDHGTYEIALSDCGGNSGLSKITIRTGDGYTYVFGGAMHDTAVERSVRGRFAQEAYGYYTFDPDRTTADPIVTWMLTAVIAPSGRRMEFTYDTATTTAASLPASANQPGYVTSFTMGVNPFTSDLFVPCFSENPAWSVRSFHRWPSVVRTTYLRRISIPGSLEIDFSYSLKNCRDVDSDNFPYAFAQDQAVRNHRIVQNLLKLDSIAVLSGTDTLRTCRFAYRIRDDRLLLDAVAVSGTGEYALSYYEPHRFAGLMTSDVDFWGYANGRGNGFREWMPTALDDRHDERIVAPFRNPDFDYALCGCLKRIVYPTGGFTEFEYESHRARYVVTKRSQPDLNACEEEVHRPVELDTPYGENPVRGDFLAGLCTYETLFGKADGEVGGVRVRRVTDHDAAGGFRTRNFEYLDDAGRSSGIVLDFPRFAYYKSASGDQIGVFSIQYPANTFDKTHIGYGSVREVAADGSSLLHRFEDYRSQPDDYAGQQRKQIDSHFGEHYNERTAALMDNLCREPNSRHYRRGRLRSVTGFDAAGKRVRCERIGWEDHTDAFSAYVADSGPYSWSVKKPIADRRLCFRDEIEYFGSDSLRTRTSYAYNDTGQVEAVTRTLADGRVYVTQYEYLHRTADLADPQNVPKSYPTRIVESYAPAAMGERQLLSAERRDYIRTGKMVKIGSVSRALIEEPMAIGSESALAASRRIDYAPLLSYEAYDACGNPVQLSDAAGTRICLVWGYGGLYPVARWSMRPGSGSVRRWASVPNRSTDPFPRRRRSACLRSRMPGSISTATNPTRV